MIYEVALPHPSGRSDNTGGEYRYLRDQNQLFIKDIKPKDAVFEKAFQISEKLGKVYG